MNSSYFLTLIALALSAITVQAQPVFTDGPPPPQAGLNTSSNTNANYSFQYTATGNTPITFSVPANELPPGLSLSSSGAISGAPLSADAGNTYTGTVTATDTNGLNTTQNFSIAVVTTLLNTMPEGVVTINCPAATTTYLSVPFTNDPVYRGVVSTITASGANGGGDDTISVADSPAPWTTGEFVVPPGGTPTGTASATVPYLVKFLSGQEQGRVMLITANGTNSVTLDITDNNITAGPVPLNTTTPTAFSVLAGDTFEIFQADTLATEFGEYTTESSTVTSGSTSVTLADANSAIQVGASVTSTDSSIPANTTVIAVSGTALTLSAAATASESETLSFSGAAQVLLTPGATSSGGDDVDIYNPSTKKTQTFFFYTASSGATTGYWALKGTIPTATSNSNNKVLYPYGGLAVFRRGQTALSVSLMGRVPEVPVITRAGSDSVSYVSSGYPVPITLAQLNLGSNWQTNTAFGSADVLSLYSTTTLKFVNYFEMTGPTWETKNGVSSNNVTINPGDIVTLFQREPSLAGAQTFLTPAMPYSIDAYTDF